VDWKPEKAYGVYGAGKVQIATLSDVGHNQNHTCIGRLVLDLGSKATVCVLGLETKGFANFTSLISGSAILSAAYFRLTIADSTDVVTMAIVCGNHSKLDVIWPQRLLWHDMGPPTPRLNSVDVC